jgi:vitamin B12/bleomycin/antimicrobial peptide transport system ATP-binding/permease protein
MSQTELDVPRPGSFLRKLWALSWPYFRSEEWKSACALLAVIVALSLGLVFINVLFNYWNNDFYNTLQNKDQPAFWHQMLKFCYLAAAYIVVAVYYLYLQQMLQIRWRRWMTDKLLREWLGRRSYYLMQFDTTGTGADNPEQRIEADIDSFTDSTLSLTLGLLNSVVSLASFVGILWTLSGPLSFALGGTQITIPGYMVWVALIYAGVGSLLTYFIGRPLVKTNFKLQKYNASFRFNMVRLRENAESVAFYGGEDSERGNLMRDFENIRRTWWNYMRQRKSLTWFTAGYGQIAVIFPFLVAAPRYFSGAIQLGGLMQISSAFGSVQDALSWFINAFSGLASWKATVDRLTGFVDAIDRAKTLKPGISIGAAAADAPALSVEHLQLGLPDGRSLVDDLSAEIAAGDKVLVSGASGAGKTTLFRALAGLWPFGSGSVRVPPLGRSLFLPQRPYLPVGTLRQALAYPARTEDFSDEAVRSVLGDVNLERLKDRLDEKANWSIALSIGEQQRLAIARALLLKPEWLYLDEATASLDAANEQRMYALLAERLPKTTVMSIAHRAEVARFHQRRLAIDPATTSAAISTIAAE